MLRFLHGVMVLFLAVGGLLPRATSAQEIVSSLNTSGLAPVAIAVRESTNRVFVGSAAGTIRAYDVTSLAELGQVDLGAPIAEMVVHDASGKLFVGLGSSANAIAVVNADDLTYSGDIVGSFINLAHRRMAVDEVLGKIYALSYEGLRQIDAVSEAVTTIPGFGGCSPCFEEMAVNPVTGELFTTQFNQNALRIFDATTLAETTVAGRGGLGIAVNWVENKAYVLFCDNGICIHDRDTGSTKTLAVNQQDSTVAAFSPAANRVYTDSEVDKLVSIIEGVDDAAFHLPMLSPATEMGVVHASDHLYLAGETFVAMIDGTTQVVEVIPIDNPGFGYEARLAISQQQQRVFVSVAPNFDSVLVIDDTSSLQRPPAYIATHAFPPEIYVLDPPSRQVIDVQFAAMGADAAETLALRTGGGRLFATDPFPFDNELERYAGLGEVSNIGATATGGIYPYAVVADPLSDRLFVTHRDSDELTIVDPEAGLQSRVALGRMPLGAAVTADGELLLAANSGDDTVSLVSLGGATPQTPLGVGDMPWDVAIHPAATRAWVSNAGSGTVSVIDLPSRAVIATIPVGTGPRGIALTPDGSRVFVVNRDSNSVSVIDAGSHAVLGTPAVGNGPEGIAALPDGSAMWVVNANPGGPSSVSVIEPQMLTVDSFPLPENYFTTDIDARAIAVADASARIAGRVSADQMPVAAAVIVVHQGATPVATTDTLGSGDYGVANLAPGSYEVEASAPGLGSAGVSGISIDPGRVAIVHLELPGDGVFADGFETPLR